MEDTKRLVHRAAVHLTRPNRWRGEEFDGWSRRQTEWGKRKNVALCFIFIIIFNSNFDCLAMNRFFRTVEFEKSYNLKPQPDTLHLLDECACRKLKTEYDIWQKEILSTVTDDIPEDFDQYLKRKYNGRILGASLMVGKCVESFFSGVKYDINNYPSEIFTDSSTFNFVARSNLFQWAEDFDLKVPSSFSCKNSLPANFYYNLDSAEIWNVLEIAINSKLQTKNWNLQKFCKYYGMPNFGIALTRKNLINCYWEFSEWLHILKPYLLGLKKFRTGSLIFRRVMFLRKLRIEYQNKINGKGPDSLVDNYTLTKIFAQMVGSIPIDSAAKKQLNKAGDTSIEIFYKRVNSLVSILNEVVYKDMLSMLAVDRLTNQFWHLGAAIGPRINNLETAYIFSSIKDKTHLKWLIDTTKTSYTLMPYLSIIIKDNSIFNLAFSLQFPTNEPRWNYKYIKSFQNPRIIYNYKGEVTRYILVDARFIVPDKYWHNENGDSIHPYLHCPNYKNMSFVPIQCEDIVPVLIEIDSWGVE